MNGDENKTGDWKMILGGILLIVVLFVGVNLVFWLLGEVIHQDVGGEPPGVSASQSAPGDREVPSFCVHCGGELPKSFEWGQFCPWCGQKVA